MKELTDAQKRGLEAIESLIREKGYPPTIREIGDRLEYHSTNAVAQLLQALERKGAIARDKVSARSIRILKPTTAPKWIPIDLTTPSGKQQYVCARCGRVSVFPDKSCPAPVCGGTPYPEWEPCG